MKRMKLSTLIKTLESLKTQLGDRYVFIEQRNNYEVPKLCVVHPELPKKEFVVIK